MGTPILRWLVNQYAAMSQIIVNDNLWGEIGTNIFSGKKQGMFGAFDRNDNIYLTLRFAY